MYHKKWVSSVLCSPLITGRCTEIPEAFSKRILKTFGKRAGFWLVGRQNDLTNSLPRNRSSEKSQNRQWVIHCRFCGNGGGRRPRRSASGRAARRRRELHYLVFQRFSFFSFVGRLQSLRYGSSSPKVQALSGAPFHCLFNYRQGDTISSVPLSVWCVDVLAFLAVLSGFLQVLYILFRFVVHAK